MIRVIYVRNPFQAISSRIEHQVEWRQGQSLGDLLRDAGLTTIRHGCVIDGAVIPEEMLEGFCAADGATVIVMPSVVGGSFTKMFAEIAVMVAAVVVTGGLAAGPLATLGAGQLGAAFAAIGLGNLSAAAVGLVGAGIALGGNLLINAFMGSSGGGGASSAAFDPTGPKTTASGATPIQKGYGNYLSPGTIIASYVTAEGLDNYLNVLVCYGWGTAASIGNISINNNSIQNYVGATYMTRLGTNNQTPIPYFNNIVNGYPQDARVIALAGTYQTGADPGSPVVIEGTGLATQGLQVVIQFPQGVFYSNSDGSLRSLSIAYMIEYSVHGSGDWKTPVIPRTTHDLITYTDSGTVANYPGWVVVPTDGNFSSGVVYNHDNSTDPNAYTVGQPWTGTQSVTYYRADGSTYTGNITLNGEWQRCDPNLNQQIVYDWSGGYVIFTEQNQGTLYHTTNIFNLPPAKYDVRVTKYGSAFAGDPIQPREASNNRTGDQIWIHSINEIQYQDLAYPNMILVGVRALGTNQVSGANINITADVVYNLDVTLPPELSQFASDNPALVAYDMLVNGLYGGGIDASRIDIPAWVAWAEFNDELVSDGFDGQIKRHVFAGIFDQSGTSLWKQAQLVATLSQSAILQIGQLYTVICDVPVTVPAQVFTSANIIRDSLKDTYLSLDDRANRIEVTFADAARNFRTDQPCAVMLPADIQAGTEAKTTRVKLLGCTSRAQAWHWAYRKLVTTDTLLLTRSFDVGIEGVACQVGSVIGVQDDVTALASGGRVQAGSTTTALQVDVAALPYAPGAGWTVSVVHPVVVRGTRTITSITGKLLTLSSALPAGRSLLAVNVAGAQTAIEGVGTNTLTVDNASGFSPGQIITLYDQDVIDTQPVAAVAGMTITPLAPFVQAPTPDCPWVYGQSGGAFPAKLFTVLSIRKSGDLKVTIDTIEYLPGNYSDDTPIITETLSTPDVNAAVRNLTAQEQYVTANGTNGGQSSLISVGWQNGPSTASTQIWVAVNEANQPISRPTLLATVSNGTTFSLPAATGQILQIRAVGVDGVGNTAPYASAPTVTITVEGAGLAPADVAGLGGSTSSEGTALYWSAVADAASYEVRYNEDASNTNWQSANLLYAGSALAWADTQVRLGVYLVKALTATAVESISPAAWNYLLSPARVNIALAPNQTVELSVTQNDYDAASGMSSVTITVPAQSLARVDGTTVQIPSSGLQWVKLLAASTPYYFYLYLSPYTYALGCSTGGATLPPTAANGMDAAGTYANGNYPCATLTLTTAGSTAGSGTVPGGFTGTGGGPPSGGHPIAQQSPN